MENEIGTTRATSISITRYLMRLFIIANENLHKSLIWKEETLETEHFGDPY